MNISFEDGLYKPFLVHIGNGVLVGFTMLDLYPLDVLSLSSSSPTQLPFWGMYLYHPIPHFLAINRSVGPPFANVEIEVQTRGRRTCYNYIPQSLLGEIDDPPWDFG